MGILQLISTSNFITVNKDLIKALGLEEAILLGELASEYDYWSTRNEIENGYFYSTIDNIEEKTTLTAYKQRKCLENLKNKGIIDIQIKGMPAKRYIKINEEQVFQIFNNKLLKDLTTRSEKFLQQDIKKLNGNNNIINNNINKNILYNEDVEKINQTFLETIGSTNINNIKECIEYLDKLEYEVIEYALKQTARAGAKWDYTKAILDNYVSENINTLDKVTTKEIEFKNKNKKQVEDHKETKEERIARLKREWGEEDED